MTKINFIELDKALNSINKGGFVSFDSDTVKKIRKNTFIRKITTGIVANASTDYRKRTLKANPDYVFTPKTYLEKVEGSHNMIRHKGNGTIYFSIPFKPDSKIAKPKVEYFLGESKDGEWKAISYDEYQAILPASGRDDYKKTDREEKNRPLDYRTFKAESITAFRVAGGLLTAA